MKAAILAVGSELLGTDKLDTNSLRLTAVLEGFGAQLIAKAVVGDDEAAIVTLLLRFTGDADLVLVTGGLGPTADDVTRPATAAAFGRTIAIDETVVEELRQRFASFGRRMPEVNRRQAEVIAGAELLRNRRGSAPGMRLEHGTSTVFLFPGVPVELESMIADHLEPWLRSRLPPGEEPVGIERRVVKFASLPESTVEERIAPAYERFGRADITVLASPGEVRVHLSAHGTPEVRRQRLAEMQRMVRELGGQAVFTEREEDTLESVVGELLRQAGQRVTTAESCTGGLLAERLTRVPGSSDYFPGGVVTYSNELKTRLLGVPAELLATHGAVSEPVARAMAQGARETYGCDYGLGITGVAGPGGGSDEKPVGTVHLALAGPGADEVEHRRVRFPGDRQMIRWQTSQLALDLLRRKLLAGGRGENVLFG